MCDGKVLTQTNTKMFYMCIYSTYKYILYYPKSREIEERRLIRENHWNKSELLVLLLLIMPHSSYILPSHVPRFIQKSDLQTFRKWKIKWKNNKSEIIIPSFLCFQIKIQYNFGDETFFYHQALPSPTISWQQCKFTTQKK